MKQVDVKCGDGQTVKTFFVHKFSPLDGRAIVAGYPLAILAKEHTYQNNAVAMRNLLRYVSVGSSDDSDGVHLVNDELINEHVPDWWTLVQLEYECLRFNCSFLEGTDLLSAVKASLTTHLSRIIAEQLERLEK